MSSVTGAETPWCYSGQPRSPQLQYFSTVRVGSIIYHSQKQRVCAASLDRWLNLLWKGICAEKWGWYHFPFSWTFHTTPQDSSESKGYQCQRRVLYTQTQDWVSDLQQILRQMLDFPRRYLNYQQKADENQQLNPVQIYTVFFFLTCKSFQQIFPRFPIKSCEL